MPLKGKYIKYSQEITLEIFTLIYNKLINSGWTEHSNKIIEVSYSQFKTHYNYLTHQQDKTFNTHVCPYEKEYAETTVQEILGYDPFVKEFVFPEKWYVRVSDKNVKDIQLFKSKSNWSGNAAKYKAVGYEGVGYNNLPENYTEITFDQFKKYVLKEPIEQPKKEVKFEIGEWYKYEKWYIKYLKHYDGIWTASEYINDTKSYRNSKGCFGGSNSDSEKVLISLEEIQQYLPENHPDKIKSSQEFKVGDYIFVMIKGKNFGDILKVRDSFIEKKSSYSGVWINHTPRSFGGGGFRLNGNGYIYGKDVRHATPEEVNQHLISIGQIPAGEPLNTGIEPDKDGMFKYTIYNGSTVIGKSLIIPGPLKMTLSIDDEELPMVNIIKTKTVNLLNLE